jgi:hypothetical protein
VEIGLESAWQSLFPMDAKLQVPRVAFAKTPHQNKNGAGLKTCALICYFNG